MQKTIYVLSMLFSLALAPRSAFAQSAVPIFDSPLQGCYEVAAYGVSLFGTGAGSTVIQPPAGTVVDAYIEWVGVEDTSPGGEQLDGASDLTINGVTVSGTLAEPFTATQNAGFDPLGYSSTGDAGWFAWHARIGSSGYAIIPDSFDSPFGIEISDWDSPAPQTNGATISLIYEAESCDAESSIQFSTGVRWYYAGKAGREFTDLLVYEVDPEPLDRTVRMIFSHAGTTNQQQTCRGGAIWMVADDGTQPTPGDADFDIVANGDNDGDGIVRGYGINGGVEIVNDPFTSESLTCPSIRRRMNPTRLDTPTRAAHRKRPIAFWRHRRQLAVMSVHPASGVSWKRLS